MKILDKIVNAKKEQLRLQKQTLPEKDIDLRIEKYARRLPPHSFIQSVRRNLGENIKVIAEIKKASPSKGIIRENFDYKQIARIYSQLGVDAISVLTEKQFFLGSLEFLNILSSEYSIPMLRKDFIVDGYQVKEAFINGASAVLLISAILDLPLLKKCIHLCDLLGIDYIVEIHDPPDLEKALEANPAIIGINNRDLRTFAVDLKTTERLMDKIPEQTVVVSESGIHSRTDVLYLAGLGVDAVLIGEALMKADDIRFAYNEIFKNGDDL